MPVQEEASDAATFSNLNPETSDADALGGNSSRVVWGTNVSVSDSQHAIKDFFFNFQRKYRMIQDGELEEGVSLPADHPAMSKEYVETMKMMLELGVTPLNLDARNLKSYPPTRKLWHQLQAFPNEIIPIIDLSIKDVMIELAERRMAEMRVQLSQAQRGPQRGHTSSSLPPMLDSDAPTPGAPSPGPSGLDIPDLVKEVEQKVYRVRPFGLDNTINLRDLNPGDMDKMVSVKGLVIRTTPIIPDMKDGKRGLSIYMGCADIVQLSFDAPCAIIQLRWTLTVARLPNPPDARVQSVSPPTPCRSSTTDQDSRISRLSSSRRHPTTFQTVKHLIQSLYVLTKSLSMCARLVTALRLPVSLSAAKCASIRANDP
jgi:DNA replicative helicase MCM subunit Mcm2 (Cdc46/Mcm family)